MNNKKDQSLKKISHLITELQSELFKLTGSKLFIPNSTELFASNQEQTLDDKIDFVLTELGVPGSINGHSMIHSALKYMHNATGKVYYTKQLYPYLAAEYSKTSCAVERNIIHAIAIICKKGNVALLKQLFPNLKNIEKGIPNKIFLPRILEYVEKGY